MNIHYDLLGPFIVFAVAASFTPGPNNFMFLSSGLNFGLRRTLPHIFGVVLGFAFLIVVAGIGLGAVFTAFPILYVILKYAGAAYMLYLAWLIAKSDIHKPKGTVRKKPITFLQAAAFQWVNLKGCIAAISAVTTYAAIADYPYNIAIMGGVFLIVCSCSSFLWAGFGLAMQRCLKHPKIMRAFNIVMALLLVASIYPVLRD